MPKQDCKYWDKCYQKNEYHKDKYNHPLKVNKNISKEQNLKGERSESIANHKTAETPQNEQQDNALDIIETASCSKETKNIEDEPSGSRILNNEKKLDDQEQKSPIPDHENSTGYVENREEFDITEERNQVYRNLSGKNYLAMLERRIKLSEEKEYAQLVSTNEFIRHKFLVEMPTDFYKFWKFAGEISKFPDNGEAILSFFLKEYQLKLVGPFEFLAGRFHKAKVWAPGDYLRHWRFFYDPPEFQTIMVKRGTGIHYGYWRDSPDQKEKLLIACNDSRKNCQMKFIATNIFEAFLHYINHDSPKTPFTAASEIMAKKCATDYLSKNELQYEKLPILKKERQSKVIAPTFHGAGIVVPYQKKTEIGYRPMIVTDEELKKIFSLYEKENVQEELIMEKLQPIANACTIAMDECDFGTALEFGIDLFCSGRTELHGLARSMLFAAYGLLNRPQYIAIAKAHLEDRRRDIKLSNFE